MWNRKTIEWIDVELTSFCNIACPGCLRQEKREQVESISQTVQQLKINEMIEATDQDGDVDLGTQ